MASGTQGGGIKRSGSRGTVPSAGRAPGVTAGVAAPLSASAFTEELVDADPAGETQEIWLAQDGEPFVEYETGFAASEWRGQINVLHGAGSSGANCPTLIPGGAEGGRDALRFTLAAASRMVTGAHFAVADGERLGLCVIGRVRTVPPVSLARIASLIKTTSPALALEYAEAPELRWRIFYDDGGAGTHDTVSAAYSSTSPFAFGVFATSPHTRYLNGVETAMPQSAGILDVGGGAHRVAFGRGGFGDFTGGGDFDLWCALLYKMTGVGMPACFAAQMALAASYWQTPALSGGIEPVAEVRRHIGGGTQGRGIKRWAPPFPSDGLPLQGIVRDSSGLLISRDSSELLLVRG